MDYKEYKANVIDKTQDSEGLLYSVAVLWLHPRRLPLGVVHIGNCTDRVVKIPNWSKETRIVQWSSGPEKMTGPIVPIIAFSKNVFCGNVHITDVILQSNIGKIPNGAFSGCTKLQRITIPKSIKYIGEGTFKDCNNLEDVYYAGSEDDWKKIEIVHEGARPKDPKKLGLHVEIKHYDKVLYKIDGDLIKDFYGKVLYKINGNNITDFSGKILFSIQRNEVKDFYGEILYRLEGSYIKTFSGEIVYKLDGSISGNALKALIAIID